MNTAFRRYERSWFVVFCLAAILAIIACNLWSLYNGHCAVNDFLRIPPIGWMLIFANVVAGLVLYLVKHRRKERPGGTSCAICHTGLRDGWSYCPNCGGECCD